jgi:hypothetical protein
MLLLLLLLLAEVRRRRVHHARWGLLLLLHLGPGRWRRRAVGQVRGRHEGLQGLLSQRTAVLLEGRRPPGARRLVMVLLLLVVLLVVVMVLLLLVVVLWRKEVTRKRHSGLHAHVSHQWKPLVVHSSSPASVAPEVHHSEPWEASSAASTSPESSSPPASEAVLFPLPLLFFKLHQVGLGLL